MADTSNYLRLLPAVFSELEGDAPALLARYLAIFEAIQARNPDPDPAARRGTAELIDVLPSLLSPRLAFLFSDDDSFVPPIQANSGNGAADKAQLQLFLSTLNGYLGITAKNPKDSTWQPAIFAWLSELLTWLSSWVSLIPDDQWSIDKKRTVLARIMPLWRMRGTQRGLEGLLRLAIDPGFEVVDYVQAVPLTVGTNTTLDATAAPDAPVLDGMRPFRFVVHVIAPTYDEKDPQYVQRTSLARALVDREKPMHTDYELVLKTATFTIGKYSTVGQDTLIPMA